MCRLVVVSPLVTPPSHLIITPHSRPPVWLLCRLLSRRRLMSLAAPATMAVISPRRSGRQTLRSGWALPLHHRCPHHRPGCCFLPSNLVDVAIALAAVANARFVTHHPRPPLSPSPSPSPTMSPSPSLARHHCCRHHCSCRRHHSLFVARHHHHRRHRPCHPPPCPLCRPPASSLLDSDKRIMCVNRS